MWITLSIYRQKSDNNVAKSVCHLFYCEKQQCIETCSLIEKSSFFLNHGNHVLAKDWYNVHLDNHFICTAYVCVFSCMCVWAGGDDNEVLSPISI